MENQELYFIEQVAFDSLENRISDAIRIREVGVVFGKEKTEEVVEELTKKFGHKYKGWDDNMYPYYTARKLTFYDPDKLNKFGTLDKK
jgi:hypothetical protein